eukprot:TRINITY_DN473_c0_g1_i2.p1 TRINITY_DN473_c0_g1~~TRINITY_DN473_c0_g1_i2.p1  ORF type:complete len:137 (-),score=11.26 TRINITY_DN473_c0_g1_i2:112-522(-)
MKAQWQARTPRTPALYTQRSTLGPRTPRTPAPRTPLIQTPAIDEKDVLERFEEEPASFKSRSLPHPQLHKYASTGGIRHMHGSGGYGDWDYPPSRFPQSDDRVMDVIRDLLPEVERTQLTPEHFLGMIYRIWKIMS